MYYRRGEVSKFDRVLSDALTETGLEDRRERPHLYENEQQRIRAMNVYAGHFLNLYETEQDGKHRQRGVNLIEEANTISRIDENNLLSMCFYEIAAG